MRSIKVGMQLFPGVTSLSEGTTYNYTTGGHTLTFCVANPTDREIEAVQKHEAVFALLARDSTLFVLTKFGRLSWKGSYYNWWINAPVMRPDPWLDLHLMEGGINVNVCLVNAFSGVLEALRRVKLSDEFSKAFLQSVCAQTRPPFDPWRHAQVVEEVMEGFASGADLMKDVFCMCGEESAKVDRFKKISPWGFTGLDVVGTA